MSESSTATISETAPEGVDPRIPHVPRVLDYLLDGAANFASDRQVAEFAFAEWPDGRACPAASRARKSM